MKVLKSNGADQGKAPDASKRRDLAPKISIRRDEYAKLSPTEKALYRPVDPRLERLPLICVLLYTLAGVALILYIIMENSVVFADWFNRTISATLRAVLALATSWIPFSLGELVIWMLPLGLFLVLRDAIRRRCDTWRTAAVYVGILFSMVATLFSVFVLGFAAGYRARPLEEKLDLDRQAVSASELYETAVILIDAINDEVARVSFGTDDFSVMPYSLNKLNRNLSDAYGSLSEKYDFLMHMDTHVKPVLASEVMSHMHITGVYSFFTGEANINVNFPAYTIPFTAAHELAHQRGIAREDEANFVAFLVCMESEDSYVRYSGYMNVYEYVANALWSADRELYDKAVAGLNEQVKGEMRAYARFYDQYSGSVVGQVSSTINNSYLQSQGTPGIKSYNMVVDLTVAYFKP